MKKLSKRQCELARVMTGGMASDEQIYSELNSMTQLEWNKQCEILNNLIISHNMSLDKGWETMKLDFINLSAANQVDEATLFVVYMEWLSNR